VLCTNWQQWFRTTSPGSDQLTVLLDSLFEFEFGNDQIPTNRNTILRAPLESNSLESAKQVLKSFLHVRIRL